MKLVTTNEVIELQNIHIAIFNLQKKAESVYEEMAARLTEHKIDAGGMAGSSISQQDKVEIVLQNLKNINAHLDDFQNSLANNVEAMQVIHRQLTIK